MYYQPKRYRKLKNLSEKKLLPAVEKNILDDN
jgi:hypothetical protein